MGVPLKLQSMFVSSSKRKHWVSPRSSSPASKLSMWVISWKVDAWEACERRRESGGGGEKGFLWPLAASLARVFSHGLLRCFARMLFAAWDAGETFQAARSGKKRLYSQATWVFSCCKTRFFSGKRKKFFSSYLTRSRYFKRACNICWSHRTLPICSASASLAHVTSPNVVEKPNDEEIKCQIFATVNIPATTPAYFQKVGQTLWFFKTFCNQNNLFWRQRSSEI